MNKHERLKRTKAYVIRVIAVVQSLPASRTARIIGGQLLRAGTSGGAHYRAVCRAKSPADFVDKLKIVKEESDDPSSEWRSWSKVECPIRRLDGLLTEGGELLSIFVSVIKTSRAAGAS